MIEETDFTSLPELPEEQGCINLDLCRIEDCVSRAVTYSYCRLHADHMDEEARLERMRLQNSGFLARPIQRFQRQPSWKEWRFERLQERQQHMPRKSTVTKRVSYAEIQGNQTLKQWGGSDGDI